MTDTKKRDTPRGECLALLSYKCQKLNLLIAVFYGSNARVYTPLLERETTVVVVAPLSVVLGCSEEFFCFCGILLEYRCVAHLTLEEVFEEAPVGFFAVEGEGVFALEFCIGVVAPELPVTAGNRALLFGLCMTCLLYTSDAADEY